MTDSVHSGFGLLEKAGLVLLAIQIAVIASMFVQNSLDDLPNGFLFVAMITSLMIAANRRLARDEQVRGSAGWIVAWRGAALALLAVITVFVVFYRYLPVVTPETAGRGIYALLWAVIALKGAALGKLKPGGAIGLRVPWTLNSRLAWEKAHRTLGRILFWFGLIGLVVSLVIPPMVSIGLWFATVLSGVTLALIEARQTWRADPERFAK